MDAPDQLHYYLSLDHLEDTLERRRVRAYNVHSMDDDDEIRTAYAFVRERLDERINELRLSNQPAATAMRLREWLETRFLPNDEILPQIFVRSLTEYPDDNSLWAEYTDGKKGVVLSIPRVKIEEIARRSDLTLLPVMYDPKQQALKASMFYGEFMTLGLGPPIAGRSREVHFQRFDSQINRAVLVLASLKNVGWSSQREWRLVSKLLPADSECIQSGKKFEKPATYIEVDLGDAPVCSRIITGPLMEPEAFDRAERIARRYGIEIEKSAIKLKVAPQIDRPCGLCRCCRLAECSNPEP